MRFLPRILIGLLSISTTVVAETPTLASATYFGSRGDDDFQAVAAAEDGRIYVVGNPAGKPRGVPKNTLSAVVGKPVKDSWYRCGFARAFNADGKQFSRSALFARGQLFLASLLLEGNQVYVGG